MKFDTKSLTTLVLALALPIVAHAKSDFPFTITRDSKGVLTRIDLPARTSMMMDQDEDTLSELKASLQSFQSSTSIAASTDDVIKPESKDDKKLYEQAKAYLKHDVSVSTLEDARLEKEFSTAKSKLFKIELFRLLAAPNTPAAFDREQLTVEAIQQILSAGKQVLGTAPVFEVFEFLVSEYVESLESRREFFQNQLLVELEYDASLFTAKEKSSIRSSIFYSRLSIINLPARNKAVKAWSTFGDDSLVKAVKACKGFVGAKETGFGQCFKVSGKTVVNRMVQKSLTSKDASLAFDYNKTTRVRDHRAVLLLAKFGLKLVPAPGFAKKPFEMWLSSQYQPQRRAEGFLFGHAVKKNQTQLADWVLVNSANPVINR